MLKVLKPGFYSTIQDFGRFGFRNYGVPVSGFMDAYSAQFANLLLGNDMDSALIEMTMIGGEFQFTKPTTMVISGAVMNTKLNNSLVKQNEVIGVEKNDIISFGKTKTGFRTYLAIKDGFKTNEVLESQSQYSPITEFNTISKGDTLEYVSYDSSYNASKASVKFDDSVVLSDILEVYKGPEFNKLSTELKTQLINSELKVSKYNNRMAYQLEPLLKNNLESILTSPVLQGTVQLTPKGNLIVLMRDCQTTGGYPRVLQLTEKSINVLSQKTTGNIINLRLKG
ncbi:biotin-dependent carboxyltransferase family protein [Winogradskyella ouciana]|uniref:Allophanate hydrolase subunit 2 family protein n=1 Tax=Winogradskyella ouciana TaxID=2608631 RepID=A0A7K1GC39_9FLAO|nr:biotin-dependent carboxyltransferase family protein [Winogradskyella ouciana]MTE25429.1 allophanate hydrolase subunit 2 family protein [Winogradskyella ouciana]